MSRAFLAHRPVLHSCRAPISENVTFLFQNYLFDKNVIILIKKIVSRDSHTSSYKSSRSTYAICGTDCLLQHAFNDTKILFYETAQISL